MDKEKYFRCSLFGEKEFKVKKNFSLYQQELLQDNLNRFKMIGVEYTCQWQNNNFDASLATLIVPIKNNLNLLEYTLNNFKEKGLLKIANVIVVDDRSTDAIKEKAEEYDVNYLRIDNKKGFNFSMLNNIPSYLVHKLGGTKVIFWNSDLWIDKIEYFNELISRHNTDASTISGSKLLYPYESLIKEDSTNIKVHFPHMSEGKYKGTVQFGGSRWAPTRSGSLVPVHFKRFSKKDDSRVNQDYETEFVTGALQVIDLNWFINSGGFNPSLSKVFQDVDLCLRAVKENKKVMYFGKNIHFYHDESFNHFSNNEEKMDKQFRSDEVLFARIWKNEITNLIF